ncbi:MAG: hypothetical protein IJC83_01135, partial [Oscillospiraceae bacterium]|nr:hypothetical protein [Oscillospiraceae bacterium]
PDIVEDMNEDIKLVKLANKMWKRRLPLAIVGTICGGLLLIMSLLTFESIYPSIIWIFTTIVNAIEIVNCIAIKKKKAKNKE